MKKPTVLLLPGGGWSSWIWERMIPHLQFDAITPEYRLPENTLERRKNSTVRDCLNHYASLIADRDSVVVVGHSGAGALSALMAKTFPEKISGVLYIAASIPPHGKSALDVLPFFLRMMNHVALKSMVKTDSIPLAKKEAQIRKYFCNTCDEETIGYILSHNMLSEPLCVGFEKVDWSGYPDIPQRYLLLTADNTHPEAKQRGMMKNLGVTDSVSLHADHLVMISRPGDTAAVISEFATEIMQKPI